MGDDPTEDWLKVLRVAFVRDFRSKFDDKSSTVLNLRPSLVDKDQKGFPNLAGNISVSSRLDSFKLPRLQSSQKPDGFLGHSKHLFELRAVLRFVLSFPEVLTVVEVQCAQLSVFIDMDLKFCGGG